jgi:hypothetical protein
MINDYKEVKECVYKDEHYSVRDNGAIFRHRREGRKMRIDDERWTFGIKNSKTGYMLLGDHRVHIIVATAFLGERDSKKFVVDHIDTNRCNNRVENLRWFTRLENALNNEITRSKIIFICGSIEAFIENPNILRERLDQVKEPSLEWMRTVTKEAAATAYENIKRYWAEQARNPKPLVGGKMNGMIFSGQTPVIRTSLLHLASDHNIDNSNNDQYNSQGNVSSEEWERMTRSLRMPYKELEQVSKEKERVSIESFEPELVQAKSPAVAWQKRWKTPTDFLCCPSEVSNNTITEYFNNLIIGCNYNSTLYYGNDKPDFQKIVDKAYIDDNNSILVFSVNEGVIKPYALSKIYISDDKIIHESIGTFFEEDGARKRFTLAQGLEWTGGDSIDDYC